MSSNGGNGAGASNAATAGSAGAGNSGLAGLSGAGGQGAATGGSSAGTGGRDTAGGSAGEGGAAAGGEGGHSEGDSGAAGSASGGTGGVVLDEMGCPLVPPLALARVTTLEQTGMALAQAPGDERLLLAERPGRVRILRDGELLARPFLDLRRSIAPAETERGLLALALHPSFAENRRFYVVYTRSVDDPFTPELSSVGDLVLATGRASESDPDLADAELEVLLSVPKAVRYHNGGMIAFGPDGLLYMAVGEDGKSYSSAERGMLRRPDNRLGKLLRLDVEQLDQRPAGNFEQGDPYVWAVGLRNPWRMSFDRATGDLYVADVGEGSWEEIDFVPRGSGRHDFGWPDVEGHHCTPSSPGCDLSSTLLPIHEVEHSGSGSVNGRCGFDDTTEPLECNRAIVGGYVYRGTALPELTGRYFYGDHIQNFVRSLIVKDGVATCHAEHDADLRSAETPIQGLVSFAEDARGELYLLDLLGNVYRVERG